MSCQEISQKLSAFLDGELPEAERVLVRQHLDTCQACAAEYRGLAFAWERLGELPRVDPRAHLWPRIEGRLDQRADRQWWRWSVWRPVPVLATLALVVGLLLGLQVGALVLNNAAPSQRAVSDTDVDPLHVQYFGDVFPGSLPDAVLNVGVETRTQPGRGRR